MSADCGIVFPAAGSSRRFGESKLLYELDGMPVFCRTLLQFARGGYPMFLAVPAAEESAFRELAGRHLPGLDLQFVQGGSNRTETVFNAVSAMRRQMPSLEYVAIHDAARPLATCRMLETGLEAARRIGGAVIGRRATSTFKLAAEDGTTISTTIERKLLWEAETPQIFRIDLLLEAYSLLPWRTMTLTDDAQLIECAGNGRVAMVEHTGFNPKISFKDDLPAIQAALRTQENVNHENSDFR